MAAHANHRRPGVCADCGHFRTRLYRDDRCLRCMHAWNADHPQPTVPEKFWAQVVEGSNGCWIWTGDINVWGYGRFYDKREYRAHRWAYEQLRDEIPEGLELDHLCRVRACVNPWHLEPVTRRVNLLRGDTFAARQVARTHCPRGHAYDEANTMRWNGKRKCRTCHNARRRAA